MISRTRTFALITSFLVLFTATQQADGASKRKSKKAQTEQKDTVKISSYDKFFKDKHQTERGVITLHSMKGRVYFEIPVGLLEREMLLGTRITATSDNNNGIVGSTPKSPVHFKFSRAGEKIAMRLASRNAITPVDDKEIGQALRSSNTGAIYKMFKIETWTSDSTAVVIDMTDLLVSDDGRLSPFDQNSNNTSWGRYKRTETFEKDKSYVAGIEAFDDNVSVRSSLSYKISIADRGIKDVPVTITATRSIMLLDSIPRMPRITDSRIGIFHTTKTVYSASTQGAEPIYYAHRWRLEPSDVEAYRRGELVEPVKPIVFYIDNNFPETWKPYIVEGVNQWSEVFEKIGFKNAIRAEMFPTDDPSFDPDNLKYSCVRYAPINIQNAMGPSWTDPRSGEIISASVYLYHDVMELINNWLFVQTSPADKRVRHKQIPDEVIGDALRYVLAHEIGHCLGFMHNMGASYTIPVDSLRSPESTRRTGTTASIMDYARFNYVAQPGDFERGVKMGPPRFGEYDRFLVKWNYTPTFAATPEDEYLITADWLQKASANPVLRFGKQQFSNSLDPRSLTEDLGDDHVRASEYGIRNLKYVLSHLNEWIEGDDTDYSYRKAIYNTIINQYFRYLNHVFADVGGIYLYEKHEGDHTDHYQSVPRDEQIRSMKFLLTQLDEADWLDDRAVTRNLGLVASAGDMVRGQLIKIAVAAPSKVDLSSVLAIDRPFTPEECMDMVYKHIWSPTIAGQKLSASQIKQQTLYLDNLFATAKLPATGEGKGITDPYRLVVPIQFTERELGCGLCSSHEGHSHEGLEPEPVSGYGEPVPLYFEPKPMTGMAYGYVLKIKKLLEGQRAHSDEQTRFHYQSMLHTINSYLK
jgi:hypothetical protein